MIDPQAMLAAGQTTELDSPVGQQLVDPFCRF
jgi:hypothetical protein